MRIVVHQNKNIKYEYDSLNKKPLIENIKSVCFLQRIFSFSNEKVKSESIRYNKRSQKKNEISLINYKFFSGRYIIYETKIKGKEYDGCSDDLIFEGEYLNGRKHGKGKEYYGLYGELKFEGEYLNGKRHGKGKEYYKDGKLKYEDEYSHGNKYNGRYYDGLNNIVGELKNGKGLIKEFYENDILKFEGEYINGIRNGKGKEYYDDDHLLLEVSYPLPFHFKLFKNSPSNFNFPSGKYSFPFFKLYMYSLSNINLS